MRLNYLPRHNCYTTSKRPSSAHQNLTPPTLHPSHTSATLTNPRRYHSTGDQDSRRQRNGQSPPITSISPHRFRQDHPKRRNLESELRRKRLDQWDGNQGGRQGLKVACSVRIHYVDTPFLSIDSFFVQILSPLNRAHLPCWMSWQRL